jgi:hypothetical protein
MSIQESIVKEIMRRYDIINSQPIEELNSLMLTSRGLFTAHLALIGYPFKDPPAWMDQEYLVPLMDQDTFFSDLYDPIIFGLHSQLIEKLCQDE